MTNEQYHADKSSISKSGLDLINKSPAHYWHKYLNPDRQPDVPTEAMIIGTAVHSAILEPHLFESDYSFIDDSNIIEKLKSEGSKMPRSTNKYKDWLAGEQLDKSDKNIISIEDYHSCLRMRDKVHANHLCRQLLSKGEAEKSYFFKDELTGVPCKIRPDWYSWAEFVVDIKTTEDASRDGFAKSVYNYRYHVQAPFYLDGMSSCGIQPKGFVFIAVEKTAPYNVSIFDTPQHILAYGRAEYQRNLATYAECVANNKWPGYPEDAQELMLPGWVKVKNNY